MEGAEEVRIPAALRWALLGKGALLLLLGGAFAALLGRSLVVPWPWAVRLLVAAGCALVAQFLFWNASLAVLDSVSGRALRVKGATALADRRSGYSLRLPDGRFVEFILWNPWEPLRPGTRYTVTFGRYSRVLVMPPEGESESAPR